MAKAEFINGDLSIVGNINGCIDPGDAGDAYHCVPSDTRITALVAGTFYVFKAGVANTGAASFAFNGLAAAPIKKMVGAITTDLADNDIQAGQWVVLVYDGVNFQMVSQTGRVQATALTGIVPVAQGGTGSATPTGSIYFPAASMDVEGGCALGTAAVLVTNGPKLAAITCTDADTDGIDFDVMMPDGWNAGTVTVELAIVYAGTTHDTHVFDMNFSGQCVRNGDAVAAWAITSGATAESSSNVEVQFTASDFTGTANLELKKASSAITLSGTCAAGAHVYMHGLVDAASTTFTPMTELKIVGVKVEYQRNAND